MNTDNTQGGAEPSPASAGSQPVAWAVVGRRVRVMGVSKESVEEEVKEGERLAPLYTHPVPPDRPVGLGFDDMRLTDDERALIQRLAEECEDGHPRAWTNRSLTSNDRATLRVMLERIGLERGR